MWTELKEEIELTLAQLREHFKVLSDVRKRITYAPPSDIEILALAAFLHSFYNGAENLFKRISVWMDGGPPRGEFWHLELLDSMARPTATRPTVISERLRDTLKGYLDFRHVFRHAYSYELQWGKMSPLVLNAENTFGQLQQELERFLRAIDQNTG